MSKLKFAIVGCGRISTKHFEAIKQHANRAEITDVCDIDSKRSESAAQITSSDSHTDFSSMLKTTRADVVVFCTPSGIHAEQAIKALEGGFHVIVEKPMATKLEDGRKMIKVADEANKKLFVVKQNRFNSTLQLLKEAVQGGKFGKIYMVNINVFWSRPQEYYDMSPWRGTWEMDGGAFMNQASHYVDLLDWIVGPIEAVNAFTATRERKIEAEDTGVVNIKWRSGALGSMNVTVLTYPKNFEGSITIIGEKGTARIGGLAVNQVEHWEFLDHELSSEKIQEINYDTTSVYGFGHPLYYKNVLDCFEGAAVPETDGREAFKSLEVLVAIYRSSRDRCTVGLPLEV